MGGKVNNRKTIWQVATGLRDQMDTPPPVQRLAVACGLSERQFHRLFLSVMGETPAKHIRRLRLERAAAWLAYTDFPVIDAALAGGVRFARRVQPRISRTLRVRTGCFSSADAEENAARTRAATRHAG
jgi:transcriptional regulator GlxA family with amidase domain